MNTEEIYEQVGGELLRRRGHELDDRLLRQMIGRPSRVALPMMIHWYGLADSVEQLERETDEIFVELLPTSLAPMPGAARLLQWLEERDVDKVVVTSSRQDFARNVLGQLGWIDRFKFLVTAEQVEHGKPHPDIYLLAARRLGIAPAHLVVLEDSENGCRAAVHAGTCCVAVPHRRTADHDFQGTILIIDSLADPRLYQLLEQGGIGGRRAAGGEGEFA